MKDLVFCAPCLFGVEGIVANELKFMGIENVSAQNGRVLFGGGYNAMARANIGSRCAERILLLLSEFEAKNFEELFEAVKKIPWECYLAKKDSFPVRGRSLSSKLFSIPSCQKIIKKAIAQRLKLSYRTDWFEETGAVHQVQFLILKDKVSIMLDTSGAGLHKRGYRAEANAAPIKETLAAAMAELAHVRPNHTVIDPMCGSGTILIESALKAMRIAPGINRPFAAEQWEQIPPALWKDEREAARSLEKRECDFQGFGYDIDALSLETAKGNAAKAGVLDKLIFEERDISRFEQKFERASVITNPPYGERMLDVETAESLYGIMGERFIRTEGWSYTVISPDDDFEKCFGKKADKRRKLYNGMLKCQVFMYFK